MTALIKNEYITNGNESKIIIIKRSGERYECIVDTEDLNRLKVFNWNIRNKCTVGATYYAVARMKGFNSYHSIYMHRLVMSFPENMEIDHLNHNGLDNRKANLKVCTSTGNAHNRPVSIKNKTGHNGVYVTENGKYGVKITAKRKTYHLGRYETLKEAISVRVNAEKKYF